MNKVFLILSLVIVANSNCWSSPIPSSKWQMACSNGLLKQQLITPDKVTLIEAFYQDQNCLKPTFEFITKGLIQYPSLSSNQIDFTYSEITLTIYEKAMIEDFNNHQVCGFTDWRSGAPQKVTGLRCALFNYNKPSQIPNSGDQKFGIYKIEEGRLYYGKLSKEFDGSTQEKRPQEYDLTYYLQTP